MILGTLGSGSYSVRVPFVKVPLVIGTPPISVSSFALVMVLVVSVVFTLDSVVLREECYAWQKGDTMRDVLGVCEVKVVEDNNRDT